MRSCIFLPFPSFHLLFLFSQSVSEASCVLKFGGLENFLSPLLKIGKISSLGRAGRKKRRKREGGRGKRDALLGLLTQRLPLNRASREKEIFFRAP